MILVMVFVRWLVGRNSQLTTMGMHLEFSRTCLSTGYRTVLSVLSSGDICPCNYSL